MKKWYTPPEVDLNHPDIRAVYDLGRQALTAPDPMPYSLFRDQTVTEFPLLPCGIVYAALNHAYLDDQIYREFGLEQG